MATGPEVDADGVQVSMGAATCATDRFEVGRESRYEPRTAGLTAAADWLTVLAAEWDQRLARIKALAEDPDAQPPASGLQ